MARFKTILEDNIRGKRYGKLLVIGDDFKVIDGKKVIECLCDCGKKCFKIPNSLKWGCKSCSNRCGRIKQLKGLKFNLLTVISFAGIYLSHSEWNCKCDCGNLVRTTASKLISGKTKSCGCFSRNFIKNFCLTSTRHLKCLKCNEKFTTNNIRKKFCCVKCRNRFNESKRIRVKK